MNSLLVKKLYIVSMMENKAKVVSFTDGLNIITSDIEDGSDRGKSVIMKSIYHALGADCFFKSNWTSPTKSYILEFTINDETYLIYRFDTFFRIFQNSKLTYSTNNRTKLSAYYSKLFGFKIELPNRDNTALELAPPAFSFILNYVDQDKMEGSVFRSFDCLAQFKNYKENLLYTHLGVFDKDYYDIINKIDGMNHDKSKLFNDISNIENMVTRIDQDTSNYTFPNSVEALTIELDKSRERYTELSKKLVTNKNSLVEMRSREYDLAVSVSEIKSALNKRIKNSDGQSPNLCPLCNSPINTEESESNRIVQCIKKHNTIEDYVFILNEFEQTLSKLKHDISRYEKNYKEKLASLADFEQKFKLHEKASKDAIKFKGLLEYKDQLNHEFSVKQIELKNLSKEIAVLKKRKNDYEEQKQRVNDKYNELMVIDKRDFNLEEITDDDIKNIGTNFSGGGSNASIVTIVWYMNLLRLRQIFNAKAVNFPIVFDCPDNVEMDDIKRNQLFHYIFSRVRNNQTIISSLGFEPNKYSEYKIDNFIFLSNNKFSLLNSTDYDENKEFFLYLNSLPTDEEDAETDI